MKKQKSRAKDEAVAKNRNGPVSDDHTLVCRILELPTSLLHEFFFRLSIKDIMRCKCICKVWQREISAPNFSENYVKCSNLTQLLYIPGYVRPLDIYLVEISSQNGDCSSSQIVPKIPPWLKCDKPYYSFVGSCNGFICILADVPGLGMLPTTRPRRKVTSTAEVICVSNPIFQDYVALPERQKPVRPQIEIMRRVRYRFGFTPRGNDFKVLRIVFILFRKHSDKYDVEECEIFTVGVDNQWRSLSSVCFTDLDESCDVVSYGGAFNWIPCTNSPLCISTFDIAGEMLGQIPIPSGLVLVRDKTQLKIFNNEFSVVDITNHSQITLWIMKKYGAPESWTKFVISMSSFPFDSCCCYLSPLAELQDGEILFLDSPERHLFSYNVKLNKRSVFDIHAVDKIWASEIKTYIPNFFCRGKKLQC